jgi:hypothetical protein
MIWRVTLLNPACGGPWTILVTADNIQEAKRLANEQSRTDFIMGIQAETGSAE